MNGEWTEPDEWNGQGLGGGGLDPAGQHAHEGFSTDPLDVEASDAGADSTSGIWRDDLADALDAHSPDVGFDGAGGNESRDENVDPFPASDGYFGGTAEFLSTPVAAGDWAQVIGPGASDPFGACMTTFGRLDVADLETGAVPDEPDLGWLTGSDVDPQTWIQPSLLEDVGGPSIPLPGDIVEQQTQGSEAIKSLWQRLSDGRPMPTTDTGGPDIVAALDALATRAGTTPLLDVIEAARRLVGG